MCVCDAKARMAAEVEPVVPRLVSALKISMPPSILLTTSADRLERRLTALPVVLLAIKVEIPSESIARRSFMVPAELAV